MVSNLEEQRRNYRDNSPVPIAAGPWNANLTPEQRRLAEYRDGVADALLAALDEGLRWFTAYRLKSFPYTLDLLAEAGILTKHKSRNHDGHYYKPTYLTRNWCLTALALRAERVKRLQKRTEETSHE